MCRTPDINFKDTVQYWFEVFLAKSVLYGFFLCLCFLQNQVADLKEMCSALKKEKAELEKKLTHIRGVC